MTGRASLGPFFGFAVLLAVLSALPLVADRYFVTAIIPAIAYSVGLLGLNLLFGYTGLLSFGHAMFVAIGAYTTATLTGVLGIRTFELIILSAVVAAVLVAAPIGLLCVRYIKIFFGMLTLAFSMLFHSFLFKFYSLTGGDSGMPILRPRLIGFDLSAIDKIAFLTGPFYYYCLAILAAAMYLMWRIVHSPFGLHLMAIRDNPQKASYLAVDVRTFRLIAFIISAAYASVCGAILAVSVGLAEPELAYWTHSGNLVFMLVLGGFTNFAGPLVGAAAFVLLQDYLMTVTQYWRLALGVILVVVVIFAPRGLLGILQDFTRLLRARHPRVSGAKSQTVPTGVDG